MHRHKTRNTNQNQSIAQANHFRRHLIVQHSLCAICSAPRQKGTKPDAERCRQQKKQKTHERSNLPPFTPFHCWGFLPRSGGASRGMKHPCAECVVSAVAFSAANVVNAENTCSATSWFKHITSNFDRHEHRTQYQLECHMFGITLTDRNSGRGWHS